MTLARTNTKMFGINGLLEYSPQNIFLSKIGIIFYAPNVYVHSCKFVALEILPI